MGIIINDNEFTLDEIIYMLDLTNNIPLSKEDISLENIQSKIPNETICRENDMKQKYWNKRTRGTALPEADVPRRFRCWRLPIDVVFPQNRLK